MKDADRYLKIVEWSEEDRCYVGTCPGLMLGGVHGKDEPKVYKDLCLAVNEWIKIYKKDGESLPEPTALKKYSGKFMLRTGRALHRALVLVALKHEESLNSFCIKTLKRRAHHLGA